MVLRCVCVAIQTCSGTPVRVLCMVVLFDCVYYYKQKGEYNTIECRQIGQYILKLVDVRLSNEADTRFRYSAIESEKAQQNNNS